MPYINPKIKNILFDADGTLLEVENPYLVIAKKLGCTNEIKLLINQYLDKKLSYLELVKKETNIFINKYREKYKNHPKVFDIEKLLPNAIVKNGVTKILNYLNKKKVNIYVISSGFMYMVQNLSNYGIKNSNIFANTLLYDIKQNFQSIKINVSGEKIQIIKKLINEKNINIKETIYIGDNVWDKHVIEYILKIGGKTGLVVNSKVNKSFKYTRLSDKNLYKLPNLSYIIHII